VVGRPEQERVWSACSFSQMIHFIKVYIGKICFFAAKIYLFNRVL